MEQNQRIAEQLEAARKKHSKAIFNALAQTIEPGVKRLEGNLLAARKAILAEIPVFWRAARSKSAPVG